MTQHSTNYIDKNFRILQPRYTKKIAITLKNDVFHHVFKKLSERFFLCFTIQKL